MRTFLAATRISHSPKLSFFHTFVKAFFFTFNRILKRAASTTVAGAVMNKHILLIDDDERLSRILADLFELEGYEVTIAQNGAEGMRLAQEREFTVVIADVRLPDINGIELVGKLKNIAPAMEIIVLTAHAEVRDGVEAMKNGAFDYALKTGDHEQLLLTVARAGEKAHLQSAVKELQKQLASQDAFGAIIGVAPALQEAITMARHAAHTDIPTLLLGETGTGKEVFARAIHNAGNRAKKQFVALNCSAIPADLLESELFGYQKGAFSGAVRDKRGLIEEAHEGTLFLDEIGEMPLALQSKLLRVLETRKFGRVGSTELLDIDFRIIAATNVNPREEIASGRFRADLYYRLEGFTIVLPALRDRPEDIPILAQYFLTMFAAKYQKNVLSMSPDFVQALMPRRWKGNVRELRNSIERAVVMCQGTTLTPNLLSPELDDLRLQSHLPRQYPLAAPPQPQAEAQRLEHAPFPLPPSVPVNFRAQNAARVPIPTPVPANIPARDAPSSAEALNETLNEHATEILTNAAQETFSLRRAEQEQAKIEIIAALKASGGHREKAAKLLGISPATLYRKLQKYGIS
jgi:two-component system NtrC family response regulator